MFIAGASISSRRLNPDGTPRQASPLVGSGNTVFPDGVDRSPRLRILNARMRVRPQLTIAALLFACLLPLAVAQDLAPRAYVITPVDANAVILTWSFYTGGLNFNGTIPVTGATGTYSVPTFSYYHSFSFFGRSANVTASLPYGVGTFEGDVLGKTSPFTARGCWT